MDNKRIIELMESLKHWLKLMSIMGYTVHEIDEAIINVLNDEDPEEINHSRG